MMTTQDYWTATAFAANESIKPREPVTLYDEDGSMYTGYVNENGAKHGQGTLRTGIYITGVVGDENSHLMKWTEFTGNWDNGLMHGHGVMRQMSGNGVNQVVYEGMWDNGVPAPAYAPSYKTEINEDNEEHEEHEDDEDNADDAFLTWTNRIKYTDGSTYRGTIDRFGQRRGYGILRTPVNHTHEDWVEYAGQWLNDEEHGQGILRRIHRDGRRVIQFQGTWNNGVPEEDFTDKFSGIC
jgi:hypothetical protein